MILSIIILNYNTKELLRQTLESIPHCDNWEIIVVDNASNDGSASMVEKEFPQVKIIANRKNLGFAAGNNLGIKRSQGEYVLLLNSDTKVIDNAIEEMLDYLKSHPNVGAITPQVILPDGTIDLACHRGMPTPWSALTYFAKLERFFPRTKLFAGYHQTYKDFNRTHQIDATAATAMLVPRTVIDEVGLLDERFFLYAEDLDWCKRIRDAGYQIIYYPHAKVLHFKSQSGKKNQDKVRQKESHHHFYDTMKQFYQKHYQDEYPVWVQKIVHAAIDIKKWWATR